MNFQRRTAKTFSQPGRSAFLDVPHLLRDEWRQAHEDRLAVSYEHVGVGIVEVDEAGRMLRVNQKACDLVGREAADLLGRSIFDETSPQDVAQDLAQFRRQIAGEIDRYTIETRLARREGSYFWAEVTSSSVCDASGNFRYAVRAQHDISARKQAEQERCAAEDRAQQLETQQRLLLDELNHRTKNNMQMLQSLLFSTARTARSEEARKVLNEASARITAMAAAQRVLYGRSDATCFAAEEFLPAVCQTIRQLLPPDARIECGAARSALSNDMAMPLALILNELLTNAVKHGIRDYARQAVRVSLTSQDGRMALCVEDDGEGFDLEAVRKTSSGLQLVLGLARQLHGTLHVTKNPSRACLDFPAAKS
ncbi:PAS domain S-box-containing protein [Bradyrhizobium sp. AZCC 1588]|uniref:sensor histidine kinase n=1 Tax=unclassified Bradyrhizobium TaxID=2631580 RepID=UPI002FF2B04E